jgi:exosortase
VFLYLPIRLIEGATPEWRPLQWAFALQTVGLTLYAVYLAGGKEWLRLAAFPLTFILVAVPWPSVVEQPIIQNLSRLNAAMVVEVLDAVNVPAIQHGNVIEVGTGEVGINDACSGIRSFQSSLMISLFIGEYYLFGRRQRVLMLFFGMALAIILNLCRTSILTWLAAKKGIGAIAEYHDEAGMLILLASFSVMWVAGGLLNRRNVSHKNDQPESTPKYLPADAASAVKTRQRMNFFGLVLIVWLVAVECGVELWFHIRESHLKPGPVWTVNFPKDNPTYEVLPVTKEALELLRFDQGEQGRWQEPNGALWQVFYYNWLPGRVAGYLAKRHTPDICLTATGYKMLSGPELTVLNVNKVDLPMRHYVFAGDNGPLQVYQCHWESGMGKDTYTADESARFNLIRGIWAGRGNHGQKVLEVILSGYDNPKEAQEALLRELVRLIKVES